MHGIVPGGGLSPDGKQWVACKPGFFLPVRVLSRLFRRRFCEELAKAHRAGQLQFFGEYTPLTDASAFSDWLAPLRTCEWVVYAKRPFAGPAAVLAYLSRYTHRVAISNRRLVALDERGVTFRWKDYRAKGAPRHKTMTPSAGEFMRRFLLHVLPSGLHRIRHYGLIANARRKDNLARVRALLVPEAARVDAMPTATDASDKPVPPSFVCRCCGAAMIIVGILVRAQPIRAPRVVSHVGVPARFSRYALTNGYNAVINKTKLPVYSWTVEDDDSIHLKTDQKPIAAKVWYATNPDARDFRVDTIGRAFLPMFLKTFLAPAVADTAGPAIASMLIYILMAAVLTFRPQGLFPARTG